MLLQLQRIGTYLGAVTGGRTASEALNAALDLFPEQATPDQAAPDQPQPAQAPAHSAPPQHSPAPRSPRARTEPNRSNHSSPAPPHSLAGRHLLQVRRLTCHMQSCHTRSLLEACMHIRRHLPRAVTDYPRSLADPRLAYFRGSVVLLPKKQRNLSVQQICLVTLPSRPTNRHRCLLACVGHRSRQPGAPQHRGLPAETDTQPSAAHPPKQPCVG